MGLECLRSFFELGPKRGGLLLAELMALLRGERLGLPFEAVQPPELADEPDRPAIALF